MGNTPLLELNKINEINDVSCKIYAKAEYMNPTGSICDRIALKLVD